MPEAYAQGLADGKDAEDSLLGLLARLNDPASGSRSWANLKDNRTSESEGGDRASEKDASHVLSSTENRPLVEDPTKLEAIRTRERELVSLLKEYNDPTRRSSSRKQDQIERGTSSSPEREKDLMQLLREYNDPDRVRARTSETPKTTSPPTPTHSQPESAPSLHSGSSSPSALKSTLASTATAISETERDLVRLLKEYNDPARDRDAKPSSHTTPAPAPAPASDPTSSSTGGTEAEDHLLSLLADANKPKPTSAGETETGERTGKPEGGESGHGETPFPGPGS